MALDLKNKLDTIDHVNIIEQLDEGTLVDMGKKLCHGFDIDEDSRREWLDNIQKWTRLALQVSSQKTYPWPKASNVQYPLLATAALQFQARAYPALVPGQDLVKAYITGVDKDGKSFDRAQRVGRHMSYQIMYEMDHWEEDMDKLCLVLPIVGTAFKKTYFDPLEEKNVSQLVYAHQLVVNYWSKSLKESARINQILHFNSNEIVERQRSGLWKNCDLGSPIPYNSFEKRKESVSKLHEPDLDYTTPHGFIETHTWWDLDDDGYREPWVITTHLATQTVVRIVPRFDPDDVIFIDGKIAKIKPIEYFTKYGFIPNPDGSAIYDVGFGLLLGNINYSLDTLINQLTDAGTLNNLQAGFIGRGIRIKGGAVRFQPGEWKQADFSGDDIKKNIFPLPTKEPSDVLFKLFEALLQSGKELASVAEIMVGKLPGQNTPATTTQLSVDQSMKIFTAIYKRMYRALSEEYAKLFRLNQLFLPDGQIYFQLNDPQQLAPQVPPPQIPQGGPPGTGSEPGGPPGQQQQPNPQQQAMLQQQMQQAQQQAIQQQMQIEKDDYKDNILIKPNADPNIVSDGQRLSKAQGLLELVQLGTVNVQEATRQILEAQQHENINALLQPNPQQPDPKQIELQMKMQLQQQKMELDQQKAAMDMHKEEMMGKMDITMKQMELKFKEAEMALKAKEAEMKMHMEMQKGQMDMHLAQQQAQQHAQLGMQEHAQNMTLSKEQHHSNMQMNKEKMAMQKEKMNANKQGNVGRVEK